MDSVKVLFTIVVTALISACSVGPDYVKPPADVPVEFKESGPWKVARPQDTLSRGEWWQIYHDSRLNSLEERVTVSNQNLIAAEANFRQSQALVRATRSGYFPQVSAGASVNRARSSSGKSSSGSGSISTNFLLSAEASWELDVWGRIRRSVEASQAGSQASAADLESLRLSTQAELALNYFQLQTIDAQTRLYEATISSFRQFLKLTNDRYAVGVVSQADVLQAETQLRSTQAQALDLGVLRAQLEHAIAHLVGKPPAQFSLQPAPQDSILPRISLSQPSELLERRPDIAAAERRVAEANADIGLAKVAYFPAITLSSTAGFAASAFSNWLTWPNRVWSLGAVLAQTVFDGGLRSAQTDEARAVYDATVAAYRETVLTGFVEVEDNLAALRILEEEALVQDQALQAAQQVLSITTHQYQAGTVAYLSVLVAQTTVLANKRSSVALAGRKYAASVLLVKALGGGWIPEKPDM
ncbi:MAG: efflux transporter outer membrane subunit [Desulfobacteraceae bacterium]|nr:efflux transporter outer membrane subunit [Desulfobacteraceae bacterium]